MVRAKLALSVAGKIVRTEALARGELYYFTGNPCKRGHVSKRYLANQTCVECSHLQQRAAELIRAERMQEDAEFYAHRRQQKNSTSSKWRKAHCAEKSAEWAQWRAMKIQATPAWADHEKIKAFYKLARAFSDLYVPHHVDHIFPLNGETVSGLHVEHNLQVIPAQDNLLKGNRLLAA
jgi:hypothetical protein